MKQIDRTRSINYRWWRPGKEDILEEHVDLLNEEAEDHIWRKLKEGYYCGQMICTIDTVEYRGWWDSNIGG